MHHIGRIALALPLMLSISLVGCGHRRGADSSARAAVLRTPLAARPTTLDPALVEDVDTVGLIQQVFGGLVRWGAGNRIVPDLAESWQVSPDGRVYTFRLRAGARFQQPIGRTVTATDVAYSLNRAMRPATKSPTARSYLGNILGSDEVLAGKTPDLRGIRVLDATTLSITIDRRRPYFLGKLTYPCAYVVCREAIEQNEGRLDEKAMVGTGPFRLDQYRLGYSVSLAANATYHEGAPRLARIEMPILADSNARQTRYESGGLDLVDVQRPDLPRIRRDPVLSKQLRLYPRANTWYLAMNQVAYAPFRDRRVRRAIAMAIDRKAMVASALQGTGTPATGIVPPGIPGRNEAQAGLPYDPAAARALLAQAGYPGGKGMPKLLLSFRQGTRYVEDCVIAIRSDLKRNLGMDVEIQPIEWAQFLTQRNRGDLACYFLSWYADYLDPENFLSMLFHTGSSDNTIGYSNPKVDQLCDAADVEPNPVRRMALYSKAEQAILDDSPWAVCFHLGDLQLVSPRVSHVEDCLMGHTPHIRTEVRE